MLLGTGILQQRDPSTFCKINFLQKNDFIKEKATTEFKLDVEHFEEMKEQFLIDIKEVVIMEEIPDSLIINWDQPVSTISSVSEWTVAKEGSNHVEVVGLNDKQQIMAVSLCRKFLPIQLVLSGNNF